MNDERTDVLTFGIFASRRATPVVSLSCVRAGSNELNFDDRALVTMSDFHYERDD